jgi:two-component system OmpR family response regulator
MADIDVLLIEDEPVLAEAVIDLLAADNISVTWVPRGDEGLERLLSGGYAAAVVDILLPGMNGYAVVRDARAAGVTTPIMVLTAKTGVHDEAEALDFGADAFMSKPFDPVSFTARVKALTRRAGAPWVPDGELFGPVRLNSRLLEVTVGDDVVTLSRREYELAAALVRAGGAPVPKRDLLEAVWGPRGDTSTVEVYIGYLRTKFAAAFGDVATISTGADGSYRLLIDT